MNPVAGELQEIYRNRVLEHSRHPHNCRTPDGGYQKAQGFNALCGDKVTVYLQRSADIIQDVAFTGTGCAISIASASMMTDALRGKTATRAMALVEEVQHMLADGEMPASSVLQETQALAGVRNYPSRIKCAMLAWSAAAAALDGTTDEVTTEAQDQ
jgi:nitrogen fixation NifU-like protein